MHVATTVCSLLFHSEARDVCLLGWTLTVHCFVQGYAYSLTTYKPTDFDLCVWTDSPYVRGSDFAHTDSQ